MSDGTGEATQVLYRLPIGIGFFLACIRGESFRAVHTGGIHCEPVKGQRP
jgi:hypothetical protein